MAKICQHVKRTEATVVNWINDYDFPAGKDPEKEKIAESKEEAA